MTKVSPRGRIDRRSMLLGSAAYGTLFALAEAFVSNAQAQTAPSAPAPAPAAAPPPEPLPGVPFPSDYVRKLAEALAAAEYQKPTVEVPEPFSKLNFDQYRDIRFRSEQAIWRPDRLDFEVHLLPMGWLYNVPVEIWLVENGEARKLKPDGSYFQMGPQLDKSPPEAPFGFSGFRILGPLNRSDVNDEYVVFQGASYFRAVGRDQHFGLSARGLCLNTAQPSGEEFPIFRSFFIEKPKPGAPEIIVHGLLDSPSGAGAFRFIIQPGAATVMDVDATLFPRHQLTHLGLAPLTSMFLHGSANHRINNDFRPSVHDSDGLVMLNGKGERIWRPLTNPQKLQVSAFLDRNPKGFGLAQRDRTFAAYEDLDARYERRPSAWVEPKGGWGDGYIELIEIPTEEEIHDNIIVYWKPATPLNPGTAHRFVYRLHWTQDIPASWSGAWVRKTFVGGMKKADTQLFVVDFEGPNVRDLRDLPVAQLGVSAGSVANLSVQRHPQINGVRVTFDLNTSGTQVAELRLALKSGDQLISETWLFRWTQA